MENRMLNTIVTGRVAESVNMCNNGIGESLNLDNEISTKPTAQVSHEVVAMNGCLITMNFSDSSRFDICWDISKMLIEAFVDKRRNCNE